MGAGPFCRLRSVNAQAVVHTQLSHAVTRHGRLLILMDPSEGPFQQAEGRSGFISDPGPVCFPPAPPPLLVTWATGPLQLVLPCFPVSKHQKAKSSSVSALSACSECPPMVQGFGGCCFWGFFPPVAVGGIGRKQTSQCEQTEMLSDIFN